MDLINDNNVLVERVNVWVGSIGVSDYVIIWRIWYINLFFLVLNCKFEVKFFNID